MRKLCKTEDIIFLSSHKVVVHRFTIIASSEIMEIRNSDQFAIEIGTRYKFILQPTILGFLEPSQCPNNPKFPLTFTISADGLESQRFPAGVRGPLGTARCIQLTKNKQNWSLFF